MIIRPRRRGLHDTLGWQQPKLLSADGPYQRVVSAAKMVVNVHPRKAQVHGVLKKRLVQELEGIPMDLPLHVGEARLKNAHGIETIGKVHQFTPNDMRRHRRVQFHISLDTYIGD